MTVYQSRLDVENAKFAANRAEALARLAEVDAALARARASGGERYMVPYMVRHKARGKLLARERIQLLLDRDSPFLELSSLAASGTAFHVGGAGRRGSAGAGTVGEEGLPREGSLHGGDGTNALPGPLNEGWSCELVGRKLTIGPFCRRA